MGIKDVYTGINVHEFSANDRYISWKWSPLVLGTLSGCRTESVNIETKYVLSVKRLEASRTCCNIDVSCLKSDKFALVIRSIDRSGGGIWKIQTWNCICQPGDIGTYYNEVKFYRKLACPFRPRSLLIFINPYGGKRQAEVIYYSSVRPILDLVGIRCKVILTTHQGHCQEYLLSEDLSSYDGVLAVGGDGLFSELLHGLLYRTRKDAKLPLYENHKPFSTELTPRLKIGLIPAGSTNAVLGSIHGTDDVETAAIHIALGLDVGVDVLGIHDSATKGFLRYTVSLLGYGFHGDIIGTSERMRFLGPFRYDVAGAMRWLKLSSYRARIAYLPSDSSTPFDGETCCTMCPVCTKMDSEHEKDDKTSVPLDQSPNMCSSTLGESSETSTIARELPGGWHVTSGEFLAVNAFPISCRCAKSPLGPAPSAHLGDGTLDLIMVRRCSRWQYLSYLFQLTNRRKDRQTRHLRRPFVEAHRVRAFRFQALDNDGDPIATEESFARTLSVWNVDGEILMNPNVICCIHRQLIRMYGSGPED